MIPTKYKKKITEIKPRGDREQGKIEQEKCIEKLHTFLPWEKIINTQELYLRYNPCDMNPIPPMYEKSDDIKQYKKEWLEGVKTMNELAENTPWSFTILGSVGNGKTTLVCGLLNEVKERTKLDVIYTTQSEMDNAYKDGFNEEYRRNLCKTYLLVIDELQGKEMSEYNKRFIQNIINERYCNNRKTILIGNLTPEEFKSMFDEHILSRLREGITMQMVAPDMRESLF